jgi:hypothetical protein
MGIIYSLVRARVTIKRETLEKIVDLLNITTKAERDRILRDGIIINAPSPRATGGGPQPARARGSRSSTGSGASSTENRAPSTRSRTSRRQT